jgi:hypothetical protein
MKVLVWKEQADLFEVSVLEQTARPVPGSLDDLGRDSTLPVLLIGRALAPDRRAEIEALARAVFASGRPLLIIPPYGDLDVGRYLDAPASVRLRRRSPESSVQVVDDGLRAEVGSTLSIRSDHIIETALGAGILALDIGRKPVAIRYQPKNTSGAVFVVSLQLLSYTALSSEDHRQALLAALLDWRSKAIRGRNQELQGAVVPEPLDPDDVATVLLALVASGAPDTPALRRIADEVLHYPLDDERVERVLAEFEHEGLVRRLAGGGRAVDLPALQRALEASGLHAYAREMQEMTLQHQVSK